MSVSWNASEPISLLPTCPVMQTMGDESIIAVAMPVTRLVAPGPDVAIGDADAAARARVAVGHVRRALLVAHQHVADGVVEHRVVGRQDGAARVAEDTSSRPRGPRHSHRICAPVFFMSVVFSCPRRPSPQLLIPNSELTISFVTAPCAADDTSRAYFAITPLVYRAAARAVRRCARDVRVG